VDDGEAAMKNEQEQRADGFRIFVRVDKAYQDSCIIEEVDGLGMYLLGGQFCAGDEHGERILDVVRLPRSSL
jgi:hypothetical protein